MNKVISIVFIVALLSACSNKDLYQVGQDYQKSKCINEAQTLEQHNQCLDEQGESYEEYEKKRQAVVNQ